MCNTGYGNVVLLSAGDNSYLRAIVEQKAVPFMLDYTIAMHALLEAFRAPSKGCALYKEPKQIQCKHPPMSTSIIQFCGLQFGPGTGSEQGMRCLVSRACTRAICYFWTCI
jgi:hypothetical protein